jgi:hypothetical protein
VVGNPFGDDFHEEIVVIDRFATLGNATLRNRPQVTWAEGRQWAEALAQIEVPAGPRGESLREITAPAPTALAAPPAPPAAPTRLDRNFHPASDPVLPEPLATPTPIDRTSNLRDANLRDANLRDANLRDANLRDANLRDAKTRTSAAIAPNRSIDLVPSSPTIRLQAKPTGSSTAPVAAPVAAPIDPVHSAGELLKITEESIAALASSVRLIEVSTETSPRCEGSGFESQTTQVTSQIDHPALGTLQQSITILGIAETPDLLQPPTEPTVPTKPGADPAKIKEPRILPTDDRDLLLIHDESSESDGRSHVPTGHVRRYAYRQLFSRLRRG